ncbi:MAG: hypothetical protein ACREKS_24215 [Candidatus Rokuibacteriota bacterium]
MAGRRSRGSELTAGEEYPVFGTLAGPALGAAVIVFPKNFVSGYTKRWLLIVGAMCTGGDPLCPRGTMGALLGR